MDLAVTLPEIKILSVDDRIRLVQAIWDSIGAESEQLELTKSQTQELSRRLVERKASPEAVVPWSEIKAQALKRVRR